MKTLTILRIIVSFTLFFSASCAQLKQSSFFSPDDPVDIKQDTEAKVGSFDDYFAFAPNEENLKEMKSFPLTVGTGKIGEYMVQPNDTLILVSYKIYGTLYKWRELEKLNRDVLRGAKDYSLKQVVALKYYYPKEQNMISSIGKPYLIKRGDTLKKIARKLYRNSYRYNVLQHNNVQLINNPNRIYAGFTIFYPENPKEYEMKYIKTK